jgi:para-aminobenzoate synthetase / 4-amino-4-deoxychorismate lyase
MAGMADPWRPDPNEGVFETLLVVDGRPVELDAHLERLSASLAELFPDRLAPDPRQEIESRAAGIGPSSIRVTIAPAAGGELEVKVEKRDAPGPLVALFATKGPMPAVDVCGLTLRGGLGAHKWADRSLLDAAQAAPPAGALPLIVDADGAVLEASRANVFAVRDGALVTPPLDGRILPGITRMRVMEIAAARGMDTEDAGLCRDDLLAAEEVFLTGSVRGIERVGSLDGAALATGGSVADDLAAELSRVLLGAPVG